MSVPEPEKQAYMDLPPLPGEGATGGELPSVVPQHAKEPMPEIMGAPTGQPQGQAAATTPTQTPLGTPPQAPTTDPQAATQAATPLMADDVDLIEKEWVEKAKAIVEKTKADPHLQNKELNKVKADYMQQRFQRNVQLGEDRLAK